MTMTRRTRRNKNYRCVLRWWHVCAPGRLAAEAPEREVRRAAAGRRRTKRVVAQTVSTVVGECKRAGARETGPRAAARCALGSSDSPPRVCIFLIFTCPSKTRS